LLGGGKPKDDNGAYVGDKRKEKELLGSVVDSTAEVAAEGTTGARANGYSNSSSSRRRRPNSASARRRGTTPRRNPSRS
ncbi:MAG TPA: hypothetical protein VFN35_18665, partial [Ktedonobacteraceae bacterium]|nr:hypothetical protein [Ktedonobacteraceae bacterium]